MPTGFVWHELFAWHDAGHYPSVQSSPVEPFPVSDTPDIRRRFRNLLDVSGLLGNLTSIQPQPAPDTAILRVHSSEMLASLLRADEGSHQPQDPFARISPGGLQAVRLAAGGAIAGLDAIALGKAKNVYALLRPAGHHATSTRAMGYCLLNNMAIAARHAQVEHGLARVAIVDWDVHHGNGAEQIFIEDSTVLTISIHQDGLYPTTSGFVESVGEGDGKGANINIPLPPGSGNDAYQAALCEVVVPALSRLRPDIILVGCGFDAHQNDPLGRMLLHAESFREMTGHMMQAAELLCRGRLLFCHEGGYSPVHVPFAGLAVVEQLAGIRTSIMAPELDSARTRPGQSLQPHQAALIERVKRQSLRLVPQRNRILSAPA